jgi:hypothetical protein
MRGNDHLRLKLEPLQTTGVSDRRKEIPPPAVSAPEEISYSNKSQFSYLKLARKYEKNTRWFITVVRKWR